MNGMKKANATAGDISTASAARLSLVIPVYRNEENIADLVAALNVLTRTLGELEVVFVVDGSPDRSGELLLASQAAMEFPRKVAFHSRNFGSFTAVRTGMELASGSLIAVMAADLQEPPELIVTFFRILRGGEADIVMGERTNRQDSWLRDRLSNLFWRTYRRLVIKDIPRGGVDVFACTRQVAESVLAISEPNSSLIAQLFWVGYRRALVPYERRPREKGTSAWSFSRRLRYMMDSIFSFSDLPILAVMYFGIIGCILSLAMGVIIAIMRLAGYIEEPGYAALAVLITFSTCAILAGQGILGAYLWRTFENTKQRPLRIISRLVSSENNRDGHID